MMIDLTNLIEQIVDRKLKELEKDKEKDKEGFKYQKITQANGNILFKFSDDKGNPLDMRISNIEEDIIWFGNIRMDKNMACWVSEKLKEFYETGKI